MTGPVVDPRLPASLVDDLLGGRHTDPHALLGAHRLNDRTVAFRVLRPQADEVTVVLGGDDGIPASEHPMIEQVPGLWVAAVATPSPATASTTPPTEPKIAPTEPKVPSTEPKVPSTEPSPSPTRTDSARRSARTSWHW
jgi:hypothetical protein